MADKIEDAGAGLWEPVRPAEPTRREPRASAPETSSDSVPSDVRSLFVAPVDSGPLQQVAGQAPGAPAAPPPTTTPAAPVPGPKTPVIQYPAAQPGPINGQFSTSPAMPMQTYEPTNRGGSLPDSRTGVPQPVQNSQPVRNSQPVQNLQPVQNSQPGPTAHSSARPLPQPQVPFSPGVHPPNPAIRQFGHPGAAPVQNGHALQNGQAVPMAPPTAPPTRAPMPQTGLTSAPDSRFESALPMTAQDLSAALLVKRPVRPAPVGGWRKALYTLSGRSVNLGNGAKEQHLVELTRQINQPLQGCYKVAVLSLKGGVGKTTTTATLGSMFGSIRGDRVVAVDANPDRGTLSQKIPLETPATVRNLLRDENSIEKYSDVRGYTSQNRHRLEVLASDSDPAVSEAFSGGDYTRTVDMLEKFYSIVLTDCGTGLMHSAMQAILEGADSLIVVSSGSVDGARSASATLDWLDAHGYSRLVATSVAVINAVRPRSGKVDLPRVVEHFEQRCRAVKLIPFDPHLEEGAEIDLDRLRPGTREAVLELAAVVAQDFPASPFALTGR
ncbi:MULTISPECIES: MinD/ParA family ATP-binding protein [Rhodococcus]|uniref:MinD/ParA family ATP-binding protein n=1 Tax=Rhodococcus TaxID=1827 RepID=UPI000A459E92|nr:MinD/ParA family protein [Rhodococcus sp. Ni2]MBQ9054131.1 AAA family ATPase [Rhodococcus sp. (in: high G+C Gram-positive bacteria)]MCE4164033.1 AAA family ATPase [Rhodococcus sp. Ni2]